MSQHTPSLIEIERVSLFGVVGDAAAHFRIWHQALAKPEFADDVPHVLIEAEQAGRAGVLHEGAFQLLGHAAAGNVLRFQNGDLVAGFLEVVGGGKAGDPGADHHHPLSGPCAEISRHSPLLRLDQ